MIRSFSDREAERIFRRERSRKFAALETVILRKLVVLGATVDLDQLATPPGDRLEALKGDRFGQRSIRINQQYQICFRWEEPHAYEVQIVDYQ